MNFKKHLLTSHPEKSTRRNEKAESSRNNAQLWMCLMVKVKSDAVKNNIAQEPGMLGP